MMQQIDKEAAPYALNVPEWEILNLLGAPAAVQNIRGMSVCPAELSAQIDSVLRDEGIKVVPPVLIKLAQPPLLLVISPRDKIAYFDRLLVLPGLSIDQAESLEHKIDALNLSSLVVELGGFGAAYPVIVNPDMQMHQVVNAAAEEWSHQYLAFRPLGFLYLIDSLGLRQSQGAIEMNETLAGMMADEIGSKVLNRYYPGVERPVKGPAEGQAFDFDKEMRITRAEVDMLLAAGKVNDAEQYMKSRCQLFNEHGYKIRKLNQAYFAFHGIYGKDPGSVSRVYQDMQILRKHYDSLRAFVDAVSSMTGYQELHEAASVQSF